MKNTMQGTIKFIGYDNTYAFNATKEYDYDLEAFYYRITIEGMGVIDFVSNEIKDFDEIVFERIEDAIGTIDYCKE